ncbi:MAG: hypothetical protein QXX17_00830 [Conexivisphaerales archaeon]
MKTQHWKSLVYKGPAFPPPYEPKGLSIWFKGRPYKLGPIAEEMAYHFAKKKDMPYFNDEVFRSNFMSDFLNVLPQDLKNVNISELDFKEFFDFINQEKLNKESLTKEQKKLMSKQRREFREMLKKEHGYAIIDGNTIEVANWMIEPPGIFVGRGSHPLRGRWKKRVSQSDVELNLSEDAPVPPGNWKAIIHDHSSMWLARWQDKINGKMKYVWPHDSSYLLQERNKEKYDKAMRLDNYIDRIRKLIKSGMESKDEKTRKVATVCFLIDRLGMRVGDEKDEDEADTVGATTLRVEHIKIHKNKIDFDFLGKDSVKWEKTIENPEPSLLENLRRFMDGKSNNDLVFDGINSRIVNKFLSSVSKDITAKTFRTYHATKVVENYLRGLNAELKDTDESVKVYYAKLANLQAAIFCNHKRTPPKNWEESIKKKEEKILQLQTSEAKTERRRLSQEKRLLKLKLNIELSKQTRDYNLNTSLKNYIDPRVYKSWCDSIGLDWKKLYTNSLQKKFAWVSRSRLRWDDESKTKNVITEQITISNKYK